MGIVRPGRPAGPPPPRVEQATLFAGADETAALLRATDWAATPLGSVADWPAPLIEAVQLIMPATMPMMVWWGPELTQIYNGSFGRAVGNKHPAAVAQRGADCWAETWDKLGPLVAQVLEQGRTSAGENMLLLLDRHGYLEETYWTFSYSPIFHEGRPQGVLVVAMDVTGPVVGDRRLETLRQLGGVSSATSADIEGTCAAAIRVLAGNRQAVPFAATYLISPDDERVRLVASYGIGEGTELTPAKEFALAESPALAKAVASGTRGLATGLRESSTPGALQPGPLGPLVPDAAVVVPISVAGRVEAAAVLGVNPYRAVDDIYLTFFQLAARQLRVALSDAAAYDIERRRSQALQSLDEEKTRFYQNVSHEFRTPLTLILGPLQTLLRDPAVRLPERHRSGLEALERAALRLQKLVENLLEFSRAEAGRMELHVEPTDLAALTADLASMFRSVIEQAGLGFEIEVGSVQDVVEVDREMWSKIVLNLLSNAVKYTHEGIIRVELTESDDTMRLCVSDTGIGIAADQLPRIFDRFTRAGSVGRSAEGSGIGLALVAALAAIHGGEVSVRSEVGRGSAFLVTIPRQSGDQPATPIRPDLTDPAAAAFAVEAAGWLRPSPLPDAQGGTGRLLLVEDNADMRSYLHGLLTDEGWQVIAVGNVEAALQISPPPDIVVSDVMLPGSSGLELLRLMRADDALRRIPVLLLTARSGPEAAIEALHLGADDYLVKPFDARELLARVRVHHELARLREFEVARAEEKAANLAVALSTNRRIGIAIGILMSAGKITAEQAFELLRQTSQQLNRKLHDIAEDVALTGELPTS